MHLHTHVSSLEFPFDLTCTSLDGEKQLPEGKGARSNPAEAKSLNCARASNALISCFESVTL